MGNWRLFFRLLHITRVHISICLHASMHVCMYVCMYVHMFVTIYLPDFIYLLAGLVDVSVSRRQGCEKMANRKGVLAEGCAIGIVKELSGLHRAVVYFADC